MNMHKKVPKIARELRCVLDLGHPRRILLLTWRPTSELRAVYPKVDFQDLSEARKDVVGFPGATM